MRHNEEALACELASTYKEYFELLIDIERMLLQFDDLMHTDLALLTQRSIREQR